MQLHGRARSQAVARFADLYFGGVYREPRPAPLPRVSRTVHSARRLREYELVHVQSAVLLYMNPDDAQERSALGAVYPRKIN